MQKRKDKAGEEKEGFWHETKQSLAGEMTWNLKILKVLYSENVNIVHGCNGKQPNIVFCFEPGKRTEKDQLREIMQVDYKCLLTVKKQRFCILFQFWKNIYIHACIS